VLIGGLLVTAVSVIFIASFIGALHNPGARSVPLGGAILLVMAGVLHWPMPGERDNASDHAAGTQPHRAAKAQPARPGP
jgi:hypothetical protein